MESNTAPSIFTLEQRMQIRQAVSPQDGVGVSLEEPVDTDTDCDSLTDSEVGLTGF